MRLKRVWTSAIAWFTIVSLIFVTVLTVAPLAASAAITQIQPTTGTTTPSSSSTFTDQLQPIVDLATTFAVSYTTIVTNPNLVVSSSGAVTTTGGPLAVGNYAVSGADSDGGSDSGNWTYTLSVTDATINQTAPLTGTTTVSASSTFTDKLAPTTTFGSNAVTYVTGVSNTHLHVSTSGAVTTSGGPLAATTYTVSGTDSDALGDTGTWGYTLTVTSAGITQTAPLTGSTTTSGSSTFTAQLEPTANANKFSTSVTNTHLHVSSSGAVTTSGGPLAATKYTVSGTDSDALGDTGTWGYTLTVTGTGIIQTAPLSGSTTTSGSSTFTAQLEPTANANKFSTSVTNTHLHVSSSGAVTTSGGPLSSTTYSVSGTDSDALGDTGSWGYTLTVTSAGITQTAPFSASTTISGSSTFTDQLEPTANANAFSTSVSNANLHVSTSGAVTTSGGPLAATTYTVSGTDLDALGDTGSWSYTLVVSAPGNGSPPPIVIVIPTSPSSGVTLNQTSPSSGVTTPSNSAKFTSGPITVNNATGAVSFSTSSSSAALNVSVGGAITTTGPLTAGIYSVTGSDSDPGGDTGTWGYTLRVSSPKSLTFEANGGRGAMSPETKNAPTALTPNAFTRAKHTFARWNSAPDGSGTNYTNGAVYPFTKSITLFAIWRVTTKIGATKTVAFNANGGSGSMLSESKDVLASLDPIGYTRKGSTFARWSTKANGSGSSYANGAVYNFKESITLYAQWAAMATFTVTFKANGGSGSMPSESKRAQAALTGNKFRRHEYAFAGWSTGANGVGSSYANDAAYQFKKSITLYAQWRAVAAVVNPAVNAVVTLSPFADKSATLSPTLEAQITALANEIASNHDTKITLVGFSSDLTTSNALNEAAWGTALQLSRQRALAVETYLELQLASLGVTGYSISASQSGKAIPDAENATAANRAKNNKVVATLT